MMVSRGINAASWSLRVTRADTQRALKSPRVHVLERGKPFLPLLQGKRENEDSAW